MSGKNASLAKIKQSVEELAKKLESEQQARVALEAAVTEVKSDQKKVSEDSKQLVAANEQLTKLANELAQEVCIALHVVFCYSLSC